MGDQNVDRCSALEDLLQAGDSADSRDPRALVLVHLRHGVAWRKWVAGRRKQARIHRTIVIVGILLSRPALGLASFTTTQVHDGIASSGPVTASGAMPESLAQRLAHQQFAGEASTVMADVYHVIRGMVSFADAGRSALAIHARTVSDAERLILTQRLASVSQVDDVGVCVYLDSDVGVGVGARTQAARSDLADAAQVAPVPVRSGSAFARWLNDTLERTRASRSRVSHDGQDSITFTFSALRDAPVTLRHSHGSPPGL